MTAVAPRLSRSPAALRGIRAALLFSTRLPVGGFPYSPAELAWSAAHLPAAGLLVGGLGAAVLGVAAPLGATVAAALAITTTVAVTGALHEDGLADTFDALGGGRDRTRVLQILKDSRIGTYGAAALSLSLVLRVAVLVELARTGALALALSHVVSRTAPVWLLAGLPYVSGESGKGASLAAGGRFPQAAVATLWLASSVLGARALGAAWPSLLAALTAAFAVTAATGAWYRARAGGVTGDFLGATEQLTEVAVLLSFLAATRALAA